MVIEPVSRNDLELMDQLQPEGWSNIKKIFDYYIEMPFCHPIKVMCKNTIAGVGTAIHLKETAWLGHVIVKEEYRNQGIGSKIVDYLLESVKKDKIHAVSLIATDLGFPVYKKLGFSVQTDYLYYTCDEPSLPTKVSKHIKDYDATYNNAIIHLNNAVYGEDRSQIIDRHINDSKIFVMNDKVLGLYCPNFGEGLIIAENAEIGIEMMKCRLMHHKEFKLPVDNTEGIEFLKSNGFIQNKSGIRMIYGEHFKWFPEKIYNRVSGYLG